jgi:two-component system NtrC family sensor kinase
MESNSSVSAQLKKVTRELVSYKIELYHTRRYLHSILQSSADMIFATEVNGILISFSKGGEKILGYKLEEVIGRPIEDFTEDREAFSRTLAACQEEGSAMAPDVYFRNKTGERVHCYASLISLTNMEGGQVGTVGVCRDITRWKKLQDDLVQVDRLAEIGRIASGVAHELNNPLAVISEATGWAGEVISDVKGLNSDDRQELEDIISKITAQTRRCRNITHKLLDFVRDSVPSKSEFDIHKLLKETIDFLRPELKYAPIKIDLNVDPAPLYVKSDPRLLEQVFVNFLTNAIHAVLEKGQGNGRIEIRTQNSDSVLEVSIKDNGVGIPEDNQAKMFELFYTTKPPGKGTGLGLPICQNIVSNLGGEITFHSEVGVGTTFVVRIPVS